MQLRTSTTLLVVLMFVVACQSGGGGQSAATTAAQPSPSAAAESPSAAAESPSEAAAESPSEAAAESPSEPAGESPTGETAAESPTGAAGESPSEAAGESPSAATAVDPCAIEEGTGTETEATPPEATNPEDLLAQIQEEGTMQVSTDPNYAPQSFLCPDGRFVGFDVDVANEIGRRLGVDVEFETPSFDLVVAGGWNERWDVSVGSVTITEERQTVLDFTEPYYFTPAQLAATEASGITDIEGFAGKAICVGSSTTYQFWLDGTLNLGPEGGDVIPPPEGATAFPLETDQLCAQAASSGRTEFDGWLSSSTTVQQAIDSGAPFVTVGDPVFYEPLAVATDKAGPPHEELQAALDEIITSMHEDGTLTELSEKWFNGLDLTKRQ